MKSKLFLLVAVFTSSICMGGWYDAEVELKDGSIHHYSDHTKNLHDDHFGHNPRDIVREDINFDSWWDN